MAYIEGLLPFSLLLLSALIHETGHLVAIKSAGGAIYRVDIMPLGARIITDGTLSHRQDMLIFIMGAAFNLISFGAAFPLFLQVRNVYLLFFAFCSFFLAFVNLLPLKGNDGYNFLKSFFAFKYEPDISDRKLNVIEIAAKWGFLLLSVLSVALSGFNAGMICLVTAANIYKKD